MKPTVDKGLKAAFRRSRGILRTEGLRAFWFKLLGETVYRRMDLIEKSFSPESTCPVSAEGLDISLLVPSEVDELLEFRSYTGRDEILKRLGRGYFCFLVREQGQIIHNAWLATGRIWIDYLACEFEMACDSLYIFEAYTAPQHRGRSVSSIRFHALEQYGLKQGYRRVIAIVWPENPPVYRSFEKAGYSIVGRAGYVGASRFRKYFCHYTGVGQPVRLVAKPDKNAPAFGDSYWDQVPGSLDAQTHYLDPFLANLKRQENLRFVLEGGEITPGGLLLKTDAFEEAMGEDSFLAELQAESGDITCMDVSPAIARRAREKLSGTPLKFLAADARCLPFRDSSFSTVVSPSTLDHFPNPADLGISLKELYRVMEPGGHLFITLDNRQNIFDPLLRLVHRLGMVPYYIGRSYTANELHKELLDADFVVKRATAILHNPRLVAVGAMHLVRWVGWKWLIRIMQRLLVSAQRLEKTRIRYYTGSFVAAVATRPKAVIGDNIK
jgi:SAM-dependent methyltransferase/GNAT superfamily N-acetyltransferase